MSVIERDGVTAEQWATVEANMGLVGHWLNRRGMAWDEDAYHDGVLGLVRAVQLFDPSKGWRLSTYAQAWIGQAVIRGRANRRGGRNGMRSLTAGEDFAWPLSLDDPLPHRMLDGTEERTRGSMIAADDDPARVAMVRTELAEGIAALRAACDDDIDRDLVDHCGMLATRPDRHLHQLIASRHGVCVETVRRRWMLLVRRAVDMFGEAA